MEKKFWIVVGTEPQTYRIVAGRPGPTSELFWQWLTDSLVAYVILAAQYDIVTRKYWDILFLYAST